MKTGCSSCYNSSEQCQHLQRSHSSPHTRCAMQRNTGLHDFIGHPNEAALPAHPSPHLLLHRKPSITFSYLKNSAQKGLNVGVTTCFISLYHFQTSQIPMLSSERFTCSSGVCSTHNVQPPPPSHCKPHPQKCKQLWQESSANCQMLHLLYRKCHCLISETESHLSWKTHLKQMPIQTF